MLRASQIDWGQLARESNSLEDGRERGGTHVAQLGLTRLLGEAALRDAVGAYVAGGPGSEMARSVLRMLRPICAMDECLEVFRNSEEPRDRASAIELLRWFGNLHAVGFVEELLDGEEAAVRMWTYLLFDQLLQDRMIDRSTARTQVERGLQDPADQVRQTVAAILHRHFVLGRGDGGWASAAIARLPVSHLYLVSTIEMVEAAYPEGVPSDGRMAVARALYEGMSQRNLAVLMLCLWPEERHSLHDVYVVAGQAFTVPEVQHAVRLLRGAGYDHWVESDD